jgi:predicted nucleic acid-binding protein
VVLVDTSAWVEFLRGTGSPAHVEVRSLIDKEGAILTTDVVIMELLAGARDETRAGELRRFLLGFHHTPVRGLADFESAAVLYRDCRRKGFTPRALNDCLVAVIALRENCPVLHHDRDFEGIAGCCDLRIHGA